MGRKRKRSIRSSGMVAVPTLYIITKITSGGPVYLPVSPLYPPVYLPVPRVPGALGRQLLAIRIVKVPRVPALVRGIIYDPAKAPLVPALPYPPSIPWIPAPVPDMPGLTADVYAMHYRMTLIPDKYLKSFDIYTPHFILFSGVRNWDPQKWPAFLTPSRILYHKEVTNERLAIQMSGFYSLYASIFKHEPDPHILALAAKDEGVYIRRFGAREIRVEVQAAGWRTNSLPLLSLNLQRIDKAEPSLYYQWLYIRELIALYFVDIVEHILKLATHNNSVRNRLRYLSLASRSPLSEIINISQTLPIDTKHIFHLLTSVSDGRTQTSLIEVPVPYYDMRFIRTTASTDISGIVRLHWRTPIEVDVYQPYLEGLSLAPIDRNSATIFGVPAILIWKDINILRTTVSRLPSRIDYRITKPSPYGDITWLPALLYFASNKPYITSLMALFILHRQLLNIREAWQPDTLALELLRASESRVVLYDLDTYAEGSPSDLIIREAVALHKADDLYAGLKSAPSSLLAEYVQNHLSSLYEIREEFKRRAKVVSYRLSREEETPLVNARIYGLGLDIDSRDPRKRKLFRRAERALNRPGVPRGDQPLSPISVVIAEKVQDRYDTRTTEVTIVENTYSNVVSKQLRLLYCPLVPTIKFVDDED